MRAYSDDWYLILLEANIVDEDIEYFLVIGFVSGLFKNSGNSVGDVKLYYRLYNDTEQKLISGDYVSNLKHNTAINEHLISPNMKEICRQQVIRIEKLNAFS